MNNSQSDHTDRRDVKENHLLEIDKRLLPILLFDRSSQRSLRWATDDYADSGNGFSRNYAVGIRCITGKNGDVIRPRISKEIQEQDRRSRDMAEVFTPSWVCNAQNNLIDEAWFGRPDVFNVENTYTWVTNVSKVLFGDKTWQDYVLAKRMEISCGEAPYITSRYDTVTGEYIEVGNRIGILDRKLRVVSENTIDEEEWINWALKAVQSVYGYEWQGDNVLLARENLLYSMIETYQTIFQKKADIKLLLLWARIISWNIWQMDGTKCVIPNSCHDEQENQMTLFGTDVLTNKCTGCTKNNIRRHNGVYCKVMDWEAHKSIRYVDLLEEGKQKWQDLSLQQNAS